MVADPLRWQNRSPGDLSILLPEVEATATEPVLAAAKLAAGKWARTALADRIVALRAAKEALGAEIEALARGISLETGKPISEARGEMNAVLAKFDLTISDAQEHL